MKVTKKARQSRGSAVKKKVLFDSQELSDAIKKVTQSAALNGQFEILVRDVKSLHDKIDVVNDKVVEVRDAIHDPENGIIAKFHQSEMQRINEKNELVVSLNNVTSWKESTNEKFNELNELKEKFNSDVVVNLHDLNKFKERSSSIAKWIIMTLVGSLLTLIMKLLYDLIAGHVKII